MLRLCSDSSRFPDHVRDRLIRGDLFGLPFLVRESASCMATCRMTEQESAEAIVGATLSQSMGWLETSLVKTKESREVLPTEGPNTEKGKDCLMSSHNIVNPNGGVDMGHVMDSSNPNEHLLERILSRENMQAAWKRVKANKGVAGVDGMSIEAFLDFARDEWEKIRKELLAGTYQPLPVRRVEIPKTTGGTRPLGIPTVLARLIQQAITRVLVPMFDPTFSDSSFGFRPGRSAHDAVYKVRGYIREGYHIAVDMDLSKFFDTVNHDVLMCTAWRER